MRKVFYVLLLICIAVITTENSSPPIEQKKSGDMMNTQLFQPSQAVVVNIDYSAIELNLSKTHDRLMGIISSDIKIEQQISSIQTSPQTKEGLIIKKDLSLGLFEVLQISGSKNPQPTLEGLEVQEKFTASAAV